MSGRKRTTTTEHELFATDGDALVVAGDEHLSQWNEEDRALWTELLEDAESELQKEMIHRGLAAGRQPKDLHSFADAIRVMTDEEVFQACTPPRTGFPLSVLLGAQADPLAAFELNGNPLRESRAKRKKAEAVVKLPPALLVDRAVAPVAPRGAHAFEASTDTVAKRRDERDLGASDSPPTKVATANVPGKFAEDLFNAAGRSLDVTFVEQAVDLGAFTPEKAIPQAAEALAAGVPIPIILGRQPGDYRRYALLLQVQTSGKNRAYELYDPVAQEIVWANEGDLINRLELPFSDKIFRRITAIALPHVPNRGPHRKDSSFEDSR